MSFIPSKEIQIIWVLYQVRSYKIITFSIYTKIYLQYHKRIIFKVNSSDETETMQYTVYHLAVNNRDHCCELNDEQNLHWNLKEEIYGFEEEMYCLEEEMFCLEEEICGLKEEICGHE